MVDHRPYEERLRDTIARALCAAASDGHTFTDEFTPERHFQSRRLFYMKLADAAVNAFRHTMSNPP